LFFYKFGFNIMVGEILQVFTRQLGHLREIVWIYRISIPGF